MYIALGLSCHIQSIKQIQHHNQHQKDQMADLQVL